MQKEIREANDDLAEIEFSGHHRWAIVKPKRNEITNPRHKFLDALARLFAEKSDVCIAVYYEEERLTIANNWCRPNYAEQCLNILRKITNNEDKKKVYNELVWLSIVKQVYSFTMEKVKEKIENKEKRKLIKEEEEALNRLKDFEEAVWIYKSKYHQLKEKDQLSLNELLEKVKNSTNDLFEEIKKLPEENKLGYWECLSPLEDLNMVVNSIVNPNELGEQGEIIEVIKRGKVEYIERERCKNIKEDKSKEKKDKNYRDYETCPKYRSEKECEICEKNVVHAEMKIINKIFEKTKREEGSTSMEIEETKKSLFEYIGISKLTCVPCQITISILNPERKEKCVRGTHGSTYKGWVVPHNIPDESKREILKGLKELCLDEKVSENTSEIPKDLVEINLEQTAASYIQEI